MQAPAPAKKQELDPIIIRIQAKLATKLPITQQYVWAQDQWGSLRRLRRAETCFGDPNSLINCDSLQLRRLMDCTTLQLGENPLLLPHSEALTWLTRVVLKKQLPFRSEMAQETRLTNPLERVIKAIHANSLAILKVFIPVTLKFFHKKWFLVTPRHYGPMV